MEDDIDVEIVKDFLLECVNTYMLSQRFSEIKGIPDWFINQFADKVKLAQKRTIEGNYPKDTYCVGFTRKAYFWRGEWVVYPDWDRSTKFTCHSLLRGIEVGEDGLGGVLQDWQFRNQGVGIKEEMNLWRYLKARINEHNEAENVPPAESVPDTFIEQFKFAVWYAQACYYKEDETRRQSFRVGFTRKSEFWRGEWVTYPGWDRSTQFQCWEQLRDIEVGIDGLEGILRESLDQRF